jgi:hypothetical protein
VEGSSASLAAAAATTGVELMTSVTAIAIPAPNAVAVHCCGSPSAAASDGRNARIEDDP